MAVSSGAAPAAEAAGALPPQVLAALRAGAAVLAAPDGVLVDVITPIELDAVYASAVATSTSSGNV